MITRSKKNDGKDSDNNPPDNDIDENGNIKGLIDYECNEEYDEGMLQKEIQRLRSSGSNTPTPLPRLKIQKKKKGKKSNGKKKLEDVLTSYIMMNLITQMTKSPKKSRKKGGSGINDIISIINKKPNVRMDIKDNDKSDDSHLEDEEDDDEDSEEDIESDVEIESDEEIDSDGAQEEEDSVISDEEEDEEYEGEEEEEDEDEEDEEEDEEESDMDEFDEKFVELRDDEEDMDDKEYQYFHNLEEATKQNHLVELEEIGQMSEKNIPLRFKVLNSDMDLKTKSLAINNINKLNEMDVSTGEYCKMEKWVQGIIKTPFNIYKKLPVGIDNTVDEKRDYLVDTHSKLDKAIYGHNEAKLHILQVIGKWIKNPESQGNVLAIQGPMGNGKTTLVKEGIAKAIDRPFAFIALGGASDSSYFNGHAYTYEGSHWGRIIDILMTSKCMNPIIYFDELDKVSETHRGSEIIHLLTHLTDPSQNTLFQDNYFPGINLDLSKVLFVFSFNDETKIDRILRDRMYVINTKGFKPSEKVEICNNYILPELLNTFVFHKEDIIFDKETILYIIEKHTEKEEGVRNLKRCIEAIISKVNIYNLTSGEQNDTILPFKIKDFKIPLVITKEIIDNLITTKETNKSPEHMYI